MCMEDIRTGRKTYTNQEAVNTAAGSPQRIAGDARRVGLTVCPLNAPYQMQLSTDAGGVNIFAVYTELMPVPLLRVEEYGNLITRDVWAIDSRALSDSIATSLIMPEE